MTMKLIISSVSANNTLFVRLYDTEEDRYLNFNGAGGPVPVQHHEYLCWITKRVREGNYNKPTGTEFTIETQS